MQRRIWMMFVMLLIASVILIAVTTSLGWLQISDSGNTKSRISEKVGPFNQTSARPPLVAPQIYRTISEKAAIVENNKLPFSTDPIEAALPVIMKTEGIATLGRHDAIDCLTSAIYYEASSEPKIGQKSVAQVVLNRARHPAFPNSVCRVVYQGSERATGCQFSFTCDGSLQRRPSRAGWKKANAIAASALSGSVEPAVGMATHYHADYVIPYWAASLSKISVQGRHIFYRWKGAWGKRSAFNQVVNVDTDGVEPQFSDDFDLETYETAFTSKKATITSREPLIEADRTRNSLSIPDKQDDLLTGMPVAGQINADNAGGRLKADEPTGILNVEN